MSYAPPPPPPPGAGGYAHPQTNQKAVWSLVLGIVGLVCCGLVAGLFVMFGPAVWLTASSFKSPAALAEFPPTILPYVTQKVTVEGYAAAQAEDR